MRLPEFWNIVTEGIPTFFVDVVEPNILMNNDLNILKVFSEALPLTPIFFPGALPGRDPPAPEIRGKIADTDLLWEELENYINNTTITEARTLKNCQL